jgi:uncharacterized protein
MRVPIVAVTAATLLGCGAAGPAPAAPVAEPPPAASAAPEAKVEPVALPFHLPCGAEDLTACTSGCHDGFVEDCVTLGVMYLAGTGVTADRERAISLFQAACTGDSARACMRLADAYHAGGVPPSPGLVEENALYRRACELGANQGCVVAGRALVAGEGVDRDAGQAAKLFGKVCDRGNAEACLELGKLLQRGEGAPRSPERALGLFRKACGLGLEEACLHASPKGEEHSPRQ